MRVLVTGHDGYIGTVLVPMLRARGHEVVGLDSFLYEACSFGAPPAPVDALRMDVRDVTVDHLRGYDGVLHLAAISNDPVGDLNPDCTLDLNHRGTMHLADCAKTAGVDRFVFSSSCSLYGSGGQAMLDESADFNPLTPYGESKVLSERALSALADDEFSPTYLRNATAYGVSPRLRGDLVVNNLVGFAFTTGEVFMKSDGTPWRPLAHIEDISRAFVAVLEADRSLVHDEAFNVGVTTENYRVSEVAAIVEEIVPDSRVVLAEAAGPDLRDYRVDCSKLEETLSAYRPVWNVRKGAEELLAAYREVGLSEELFHSSSLSRIRHVKQMIAEGRLDDMLRWRADVAPTTVVVE